MVRLLFKSQAETKDANVFKGTKRIGDGAVMRA